VRRSSELVKQRVEQNTADGGAVIAALVEQGMSYREIERATGIPHVAAHRWAAPPTRAERPRTARRSADWQRQPTVPGRRDRRYFAVSGNERTHVATDTPDYTPRSVERSGPAIRAALLTYASAEECAQFKAEFRSALALAADSLDLSGPQAVLKHWQAVAIIAANPLTDEEREQLERAKAGDFSGLIAMHQGEDGNWVSR
jgi:hypothetical protein